MKRRLADVIKKQQEVVIVEQVADALRAANRTLQRQLAEAKARSADLVTACLQGARDAYLSVPRTPLPRPQAGKGKHKEEAALWHLTDWQGGKRTTNYDSNVMRQRVKHFWDKARSITEIQRADHPVKQCVILFGGDMVEGLFNFPRQVWEVDSSIFAQWVNVSQLVIETVQAALSIYPEVKVIAEWGNHGRIGSKRDAIPRSDNIDRMVYEHARQMLAGTARLNWEDCPEDIQKVEIGNYRALSIHGDEAGRMGYVSIGTLINHINRWKAGALPGGRWEFRDVYVGHYHRHASEPIAQGGRIFWTGSTESENRYAQIQLAADSFPSQRLHYIDLEKGRVTAQYRVDP